MRTITIVVTLMLALTTLFLAAPASARPLPCQTGIAGTFCGAEAGPCGAGTMHWIDGEQWVTGGCETPVGDCEARLEADPNEAAAGDLSSVDAVVGC